MVTRLPIGFVGEPTAFCRRTRRFSAGHSSVRNTCSRRRSRCHPAPTPRVTDGCRSSDYRDGLLSGPGAAEVASSAPRWCRFVIGTRFSRPLCVRECDPDHQSIAVFGAVRRCVGWMCILTAYRSFLSSPIASVRCRLSDYDHVRELFFAIRIERTGRAKGAKSRGVSVWCSELTQLMPPVSPVERNSQTKYLGSSSANGRDGSSCDRWKIGRMRPIAQLAAHDQVSTPFSSPSCSSSMLRRGRTSAWCWRLRQNEAAR